MHFCVLCVFPPQRYTCRLCEAMLLRSSAILLGAMHLCPGRCTPEGYVPAHRAICSRTLGAIHPNTLRPSKARPLRSGAMRPGAMHLWHMLHAHSELCSCVRRYTARCYYAPLCPGCYTSQTTCSLRALLLRSSAIRPSAMHLS